MKDYCIQIFGKSLRELKIDDLLYFFSEPKEESEILEFKSGNGEFEKVFNNNILRTVSAFLNSSGGVLIWGAPEDKAPEKGMPKVCVGDLVPVNERKEKDQLINRISTSISYMPNGIRIERLEYKEGYIYIIEVQESESKPHQLNGQYLIRLDGQSKPAPHYLVESMFNQVIYPQLDGRIDFLRNQITNFGLIQISFAVVFFNKSPLINEKNLSYQIVTYPGYFLNKSGEYLSSTHPVLHYGRPYRNTHTISIKTNELNGINILKITMAFGGEIGPALTNTYEIDITKLANGKFNFKNQVIRYTENETFKEKQESIGVNHETSMKMLLNRID